MPDDGDQAQVCRVQSQSLQSLARGIVAILRSLAIGLSLAHPSRPTDLPHMHLHWYIYIHATATTN